MDQTELSGRAALDADQFAALVGGTWERRPASNWHYAGLCWHEHAYAPGRIIVAREEQGFRYGIDVGRLKPGMAGAGVIVSQVGVGSVKAPILRVDAIASAIRRLAAHARAGTHATIFALTGSVGKTSSCYLLGHLLGHVGRVGANGQFNYADGIVGEAANLEQVDYAVIEAALQSLGEATDILRPHVAVLTNISPVHVDYAGSLLALAEKKASLFSHLAPGGTAVINRDIPHFDRVLEIARATARTVLTFGGHTQADFSLLDYDLSQQRVRACILGECVEYELGLRGRHMALNSLGVLAALHAAGVAWRPLLPHCASAHMVSGRGAVEHLTIAGHRVSIIDDTYNASPASMSAAFVMLAATAPTGRGRRIAVLADMLELGGDGAGYHRALAESLLASGVDKVYLAGPLMRHLWEELPAAVRGIYQRRVQRLLWPLVHGLEDGDVIVLKGSHGTGLHGVVTDLQRLAALPHLAGAGPAVFMLLRGAALRFAPVVPSRIKGWVSWQLRKFTERNARRQH